MNLEELTGIPDDIALAKIKNLLQSPNNDENNCQVQGENEPTPNNNDQVQDTNDHEPSMTIEEDFICEPNDNEDYQNSDHSDSDFSIDSEESYSSDDDNLCTKLSNVIRTESDHQRIYAVSPTSVQCIATNSWTSVKIVNQIPLGVPKHHTVKIEQTVTSRLRIYVSSRTAHRNDSIAKGIRYAASVISNSAYYRDYKSEDNSYMEAATYETTEL